jgi:hypothetical protein
VTGRPASTSVSHLGANAAELLSYMLQHLRDSFYRLNDAREPPWTEFPSPFQFIVHGMYADAPRFSLPVEARARCFLTFPPPFTIDRVRAFLVAEGRACAEARNHPHLPVFVWDGFAAEPVCCATNELRTLVRDAASRNGIPAVRVGPSTGSSDMRHFARRGIPCLLYGPGRGFNPHRPDEFFLLDDLPSMMKVYLDMIVEWSNVARGDTSSESIRNPTERVRSNGERAVLEIGVDRRTLDHERDRRAGGGVDSVIEIERRTIYEVDADQPVAYSVDRQAPQVHRNTHAIDVNAVGERRQNRAKRPTTVDRDRLRDRDRTEAAWIDAIDLSVGRRLRDRTRRGLARRHATARVGVIADAGDPGPRRAGACSKIISLHVGIQNLSRTQLEGAGTKVRSRKLQLRRRPRPRIKPINTTS